MRNVRQFSSESAKVESGQFRDTCNLIVTVPDDGFVQVIVKGWPAVTSNVSWPGGIEMALFYAETSWKKANTTKQRKAQGKAIFHRPH